MDSEVEEGAEVSALQSQLSEACTIWKQELERHDSRVETLNEKLQEVKATIHRSQDVAENELEFLWKRVRTTSALLTYLKSKACLMTHGTNQDGDAAISVDRRGTASSHWSKAADVSSSENLDRRDPTAGNSDGEYISQVAQSVQLVKDVMESLATRVLVAETKVAMEKGRVNAGKEEIRKKSLQIEVMSAKVQEMEKFALGTNNILNEMRQKVEDMVEETSRQRMRAAENEQELCRVKQDFESLKSYVCGLIGVREALVPRDQSQSTESLLGTLIDRATRLQSEKRQKEAEVEGLMAENVRLNALLDKKEAQLLALNEQCKFMALREPET